MRQHRILIVLFALCSLRTQNLNAAPSSQEVALAARLFDDASRLMADGRAEAACPKYAESQRLDPQLGTLLHLGECYAKVGKSASAWTTFKEAAEIAAQRNDPRSEKIEERVANLEPALSNLVIEVADSEPATLEVRHDGVPVGRAAWGSSIPIDPGEHEVTATAPGTKPRELAVTIPDDGRTVTVRLPPIEYLPTPAATPKRPAAQRLSSAQGDSPSWFTEHQKLVAGVVGGVGVVGLGVGTAFGLMVKPTYDESARHCNDDHCDAIGRDYRQSAFDKALVADIAFGVGAAALVGGTVLWLTAPEEYGTEQAEGTSVAPLVGPDLAAISVRRRW